jgi:DNA-binding XRE family transcriptional regulator
MPFNALISDDTSYEWRVTRPARGPVSCEKEHTSSVHRVDFFQHAPIPDGFGLLGDLLSELANDPGLVEARKELGREKARGDRPTLTILRLQQGMSQSELAVAISTSQAAISRLESGEQEPRLVTLRKLAAALEVDLNVICQAFPDE